jgi:hypothetical protein
MKFAVAFVAALVAAAMSISGWSAEPPLALEAKIPLATALGGTSIPTSAVQCPLGVRNRHSSVSSTGCAFDAKSDIQFGRNNYSGGAS